MNKTFIILTLAAGFMFSINPITTNAEETPWFIGEHSFDGAEETNPANINITDAYGSEYQNANQALSTLTSSTSAGVRHFQKIRMFVYLIPLGIFTAMAISLYLTRKKIVLEERRVAIEEKKFEEKNTKVEEKEVHEQVQSKAGKSTSPLHLPNNDVPSEKNTATDAGLSQFPTTPMGDVNGDGIVDEKDFGTNFGADLNIPSFMQ